MEDVNQKKEVFQRNNRFYTIIKSNNESRELYLNRVNYIITKLENDTPKSYEELVKLSYIWCNYTYKGMSYPPSILKAL